MTIQTVNNGETNQAVREKINANFSEHSGKISTAESNISSLTSSVAANVSSITSLNSSTKIAGELALIQNKSLAVQFYSNSFGTALPSVVSALGGQSQGVIKYEVIASSVGGYKSSDILAKLLAEGVGANVEYVVFQEGTNDAGSNITNQIHINNYKAIASEIRRLGKTPILLLTPPRGDSQANTDIANGYVLRERVFAESTSIPYFDPWVIHCDTNGMWKAGVTVDNIHPTKASTVFAAKQLWTDMKNGSRPMRLPRKNAGEGMFGSNVLHLTDSNVDGLPDNWSGSISGATYALTDVSYPYRGKKCACTFSSASASVFHYKQISSGYTIGDRIRFSGFFGASSLTNAIISARVRINGTSGSDIYAVQTTEVDGIKYFETDFTVPAGTTNLQMYVLAETSTSGAFSGVMEFGGMDCYNLTQLTL